jgi:nucleotide-binding universal stress UspA family protein
MSSKQTLKPLYRSVLCPTDFSEHSRASLRFAAAIANRFRAKLQVLYVIDPILVAAARTALNDRGFLKTSLEELRAFVAGTGPLLTGSAAIACHVEKGDPARLIGSTAKRLKCDLIVMGTHGLSGVDRRVIGSTTERVFRRTSLPVLAIPPSAEATSGSAPAPSWPGPAIMVPVDLRGESARDVQDAAKIARAFGARLLLVHVAPRPLPPPWYRADLSTHWRILADQAHQQLRLLSKAVGRGVIAESRVLTGNPPDEVAALAADKDIGLVVMRIRKGPGFFGSRAGSIAAQVLRHAVTPVLAVPDRMKR